MAIHVQLRHEPAPTQSVFEAPPDHDDDDEVYVDAAPVELDEPAPPLKALPAPAPSEAFFVPKVFASESATSSKQTRAFGVFQYLAARALSAYLMQSSLTSAGASEQRMLDVHA